MRVAVRDTTLFFDVDGIALAPTSEGHVARPTVVLLHAGPGADHSLFKDTIGPRLTHVAQVVYLDQRGDGRSDRSEPSHWNLDTWIDDLGAFLDAVEIERPILLGSSVGALVALGFAARRPERVARLVLVSAVARYVHTRSIAAFDELGGPEAGEVAARYFGGPSEASFAEYLRVCLPLYTRSGLDPEVLARTRFNPEATIHWDRHGAPRVDLRADAARVGCAVLLLAGECDPSFTVAGTRELAEALPAGGAELRIYPGAGHGVFRDVPEAMDEVVRFVAGPGV